MDHLWACEAADRNHAYLTCRVMGCTRLQAEIVCQLYTGFSYRQIAHMRGTSHHAVYRARERAAARVDGRTRRRTPEPLNGSHLTQQ
jgi:DNA-binding CsgD family transcriptional regulator